MTDRLSLVVGTSLKCGACELLGSTVDGKSTIEQIEDFCIQRSIKYRHIVVDLTEQNSFVSGDRALLPLFNDNSVVKIFPFLLMIEQKTLDSAIEQRPDQFQTLIATSRKQVYLTPEPGSLVQDQIITKGGCLEWVKKTAATFFNSNEGFLVNQENGLLYKVGHLGCRRQKKKLYKKNT